MRPSLSVFFLLTYLISFTELHQALRLPLLIDHYQEHSALVDMSFWEFLVMHYETDVAHDETDNDLPFKDCGHSVATSAVALLAHSFSIQIQPHADEDTHGSVYRSNMPPLRVGDIFQPPKV